MMASDNCDISTIVRLVSQGGSLSDIATAISDTLGYPVAIIDDTFGLLAASANFADELPEFSDDIDRGYINMMAQRDLANSTVKRPLGVREQAALYRVEYEGCVINNYFTLVYLKTVTIGSFSVFVRDAELSREQVNLLPTIAQLLSMVMREVNSVQLLDKGSYYTSLLRNLAHGAPFAAVLEEDVRRRFALFGYDLQKWKCVYYFDLSAMQLDERGALQMAKTFANPRRGRAVYYLEGSDVVMLVTSNEMMSSHAQRDEAFHAWERAASGDTSIHAGISDIFDDISDFAQAVTQARHAAHFVSRVNPDVTVLCYDDCRTFDLLHHVQQDANLEDFYYPALMRVFKHDEEKGTELAYTLYEYFKNPGHIPAVCERLGIHRNTLYYRLERISEIMGGKDVRAAEVCGQIHLTFAILAYQGKLYFPHKGDANQQSQGQVDNIDYMTGARSERKHKNLEE